MTARGPRSGQGGTSGAAPELEGVGGVPRVWGQATRPGGTLRTGWHRPPAGHRGSARHGGTGRVLRGEGAAGDAGARLAVGPGVSRRSSPGLCWVRTSRGPDALCLGWRLRLRHRDGAGGGHGGARGARVGLGTSGVGEGGHGTTMGPGVKGAAVPGWGLGGLQWQTGLGGPWHQDGAGGSGWGSWHHDEAVGRGGQGGTGTAQGLPPPRVSARRSRALWRGDGGAGECPGRVWLSPRVTLPPLRGTGLPSHEDRRGPGPMPPVVL